MPNLFSHLDHTWSRFATSPAGRTALTRWQTAEPSLHRFRDLHGLAAAARDLAGDDYDNRDQIQLAILRLAKHDIDARQTMLYLLRPALSTLARIYSDTWEPDDAASTVALAALEHIIHYPHNQPRPAARILRSVRHHLWHARARQLAQADALGQRCPIEQVAAPADDQPSASDEILTLVTRAVATGQLSTDRGRLILLHRICGVPTAHIAAAEGYPPSTIRQRRNRAEATITNRARQEVA